MFDTTAQTSQASDLVAAREDYLSGRYLACLASCQDAVREESAQRSEALTLSSRALIRLGRPSEVIPLLIRDVADFLDPLVRLEAEGLLAVAFAFAGDLASARAYKSELINRINDESLSGAIRSEITYSAALVAWSESSFDEAERLLDQDTADRSTWARARRLSLKGWIASKRDRFHDHAKFMLAAANAFQAAPVNDVGGLSATVRAVCSIAREISMPGLLEDASDLFANMPWTDELSTDNFLSCRSLGWALALQGQDKYFESLRLLHRAGTLAPTPAWRVWTLLDRAAMKRYAGELASSSADLFEALDLCKSVDWAETPDEERTGLLYASELFAAVDIAEASALLARYTKIQDSMSVRIASRGDVVLDAAINYSSGVIHEALGDKIKTKRFLEDAYSTYKGLGFAWRAAQTALHLLKVTNDASWLSAAKTWIRDYPKSWIADEIRTAATGVGDDGWNRLTPRQKEVFNGLCEGLTAKKIAERLTCSPNTIRNHIHWVYNAFRVDSQPELIAEARRRRLI